MLAGARRTPGTNMQASARTDPARLLVCRLATCLGYWWCGLTTGHHYLRQRHGDRVVLICWYCDHQSPGWTLTGDQERAKRGAVMPDAELPPAPPGVLIVVADDPHCVATAHGWPVEFDWGDTCHCGAFSLLRAPDRTIRIEAVPR
jgi:hypothetical protein